jgi:Ca2+-binding EF-hand superfamily protein
LKELKLQALLGKTNLKRFRQIFELNDKNEDGRLEFDEILQAFCELGYRASRADIRQWLQQQIRTHSGGVDFVEFVEAYAAIFGSADGVNMEEELDVSISRKAHSSANSLQAFRRKRGRTATANEGLAEQQYWENLVGPKRVQQLRYAFDIHQSNNLLTVRRLRDALWELNHDVSPFHLKQWLQEMDLSTSDQLSFWEFCFTYHHLFILENDEASDGGTVSEIFALRMSDYSFLVLQFGIGFYDAASQKLPQGGTDVSRRDLVIKTIPAIAAAILAEKTWSSGPRQHEQLLRSLMAGRAERTKKQLLTFRDAFEIMMNGNGEIAVDDVARLLHELGRDPQQLRQQIHLFKTQCVGGRAVLPEVIAAFGFIFQEDDAIPTVPAAFAMLRLYCTSAEVRSTAKTALELAKRIQQNITTPKHWEVSLNDTQFESTVGCRQGGIELMRALGFGQVGKKLVWGGKSTSKRNNERTKQQLKVLKGKCLEIENELQALDGIPSVAAAVREMREHASSHSCRQAAESALECVNSILKHPGDQRLWRIRIANPKYQRHVGRIKGGANLMVATGFDLAENASLLVLRGSNESHSSSVSAELEAFLWRRKADLEAVLLSLDESIEGTGDQDEAGRARKDLADSGTTLSAKQRHIQQQRAAERRRSQSEVKSFLQGRSDVQRLQLQMIAQAFNKYDVNGNGQVTAAEVRHAFRRMGTDCSEKKVAAWMKDRDINEDGVVTFAEFVASFGAQLDHQYAADSAQAPEQEKPIASAFGALRLSASVLECVAAVDMVLNHLHAIMKAPASPQLWRIEVSDSVFQRKIGRLRGGVDLLRAVGFELEQNGQMLALKNGGKPWSRVPEKVLSHLKMMCKQLAAHARGLEHPEISDIAAISAAVSKLQAASPRPHIWVTATETVVLLLDNILKEPETSKYRKVNITNANFQRRVGQLPGWLEIFVAVGFRESSDGNLVCPSDTPLAYLQARKLELETVLPLLIENAKRETAGGKSETKKGSGHVEDCDVETKKAYPKPAKPAKKIAPKPEQTTSNEHLVTAAAKLITTQKSEQQGEYIKELLTEVDALRDQLCRTTAPWPDEDAEDVHSRPVKRSHHKRVTLPGRVTLVPDQSTRLKGRVDRFVDSHSRGRGSSAGTYAVGTTHLGQRLTTILVTESAPGDRHLDVESNDGFGYGQKIRIGSGETAETRFVVDVPMVVDVPLELPHAPGEEVSLARADHTEVAMFQQQQLHIFVREDLVDTIIDAAATLGETVLAARAEQTAFERRGVTRYIFSTSQASTCFLPDGTTRNANPTFSSIAFLPTLGRLAVTVAGATQPLVFEESFSALDLLDTFRTASTISRATPPGSANLRSLASVVKSNQRLGTVLSLDVPMGGSGSQTYAKAFDDLQTREEPDVSQSEYLQCFLPHPRRALDSVDSLEDQKVLHNSFLAFDLSGSGTITFRDCQTLLWELDGVFVTEEKLRELVFDASTRPHAVTFEEFCDWRASQQHIKCLQSRSRYVGGLRQTILVSLRSVFHRLHRWDTFILSFVSFISMPLTYCSLQGKHKHEPVCSSRQGIPDRRMSKVVPKALIASTSSCVAGSV